MFSHVKFKQIALGYALLAFIGVLYFGVGYAVSSSSYQHLIEIPLDRRIPFIPVTIWFYLGAYILPLFLPPLVLMRATLFYNYVVSMLIGSILDHIFFVLLPAPGPRPLLDVAGHVFGSVSYPVYTIPGDWLSSKAMAILYSFDPIGCTFPSSHITYSLCFALALYVQNKNAGRLMICVTALLSVAILTTKQHYLLDGVAGAMTAILANRLAFGPLARFAPIENWPVLAFRKSPQPEIGIDRDGRANL